MAGPVGWTWRFARPLVAGLVWGRNAVSLESLRTRIESGDLRAVGIRWGIGRSRASPAWRRDSVGRYAEHDRGDPMPEIDATQ